MMCRAALQSSAQSCVLSWHLFFERVISLQVETSEAQYTFREFETAAAKKSLAAHAGAWWTRFLIDTYIYQPDTRRSQLHTALNTIYPPPPCSTNTVARQKLTHPPAQMTISHPRDPSAAVIVGAQILSSTQDCTPGLHG